jgi:hypothetical protein
MRYSAERPNYAICCKLRSAQLEAKLLVKSFTNKLNEHIQIAEGWFLVAKLISTNPVT